MAFLDFYLPPFPETPAEGAYTDPDTGQVDHAAYARSRVRSQFKKPKYLALIDKLIGEPANDLEQALWDLHTLRNVDQGVGEVLNVIGHIVGLERNGMADPDYARLLRAMVSVRHSRGLPGDLVKVARAVVNDPAASFQILDGRGTATMEIFGALVSPDTVDLLLSFLRRTVHSGIRIIVQSSEFAAAEQYTLAVAAFLASPHAALVSSFTVGSTEGFPDVGTLRIDEGLATFEEVTYTGRTATTFFGLSLVSFAHGASASLTWKEAPGLGLGDSTNPATGGHMAGAWS